MIYFHFKRLEIVSFAHSIGCKIYIRQLSLDLDSTYSE